MDADAARDLVARDRECALRRHLGVERADEAVLEDHVFAESTRVRLVETPTTIETMPLDPLTDEQREIRELVRTIARERIAPRAAEIDKTAEFPWDIVELFRENDLFGILFDEEYGGIGESSLMTLVTIEELSKVCATSGLIIAVQELGSLGIKLAGTEEQKQRFLPRLASGEWLAAYALTEPGSGSDSAAMRTTARRDGDDVRPERRQALHHERGRRLGLRRLREDRSRARATAASRAFVVEADAPGFEVGRIEPKMGIKGSTTGEIFFNDCRDPGREPARRGGRGVQDRDAHPRPLAAGDRRAGARARAGRDRLRASSTRARARRWASRSRSTS